MDNDPENVKKKAKCSTTRCIFNDEEDGDHKEFVLICNDCKRVVHYECSQITVLGIQCLLDAKSKRKGNFFKCGNCMPINKSLYDHMTTKGKADPNQSLEMEELAAALERASFRSDNEKEIQEKLESDNYVLNGKVNGCKKLIKGLMKSEMKLQGIVEDLQTKLKSQENENLISVQDRIAEKFQGMLDQKLADVLQHVKDAFQNEACRMLKMEKSIEEEPLVTEEEQTGNVDDIEPTEDTRQENRATYSRVVKRTPNNAAPINVESVHNIIREAKNKELEEERQKKLRASNIIIHGVSESTVENEGKKRDEEFVRSFLQDIYVYIQPRSVVRLGQEKLRPIKVSFTAVEEKERVMENLTSLKGKDIYKGISITEDYTIEERKILKDWTEKAKQMNRNEPTDSNCVWKVRGNPKNGLWMKKFRKRPVDHQ